MELLKNFEWFITQKPNTAMNKKTFQTITENELNTILFDNSLAQNIRFRLPLHDQSLFYVSVEISRPITIQKLYEFVYDFYQQPLNPDYIESAFEDCDEWKEYLLEYYENDITKIKNIDVFEKVGDDPDLYCLEFDSDSNEYIVFIGV